MSGRSLVRMDLNSVTRGSIISRTRSEITSSWPWMLMGEMSVQQRTVVPPDFFREFKEGGAANSFSEVGAILVVRCWFVKGWMM